MNYWLQIRYNNEPLEYLISRNGEIISLQKVKFLKKKKYEIDKDGYKKVSLRIHGKNKKFFIHRLVAMMFVPGYQKDKVVNHKDGNKQNNDASNLEWVYSWENELHAARNFLKANGERNSLCTHKDEEVHEICKLLEEGYTIMEVSKITGISYFYIQPIAKGKVRKEISSQYKIDFSSTTNKTRKPTYVHAE